MMPAGKISREGCI